MQKIEYPKVTLSDIAREYWKGSEGQKLILILSFLIFTAVEVVNVFIPLFYKSFFDALGTLTPGGDVQPLVGIVISIFAFNLLWWGLRWVGMTLTSIGESKTMARLKQQAFGYLIQHSQEFFTNNFTGGMVSRVQRFASGFERVVDTIAQSLIPLIINILGAVIIIYAFQPILALIVAGWAMIFLFINYLYARWRLKNNLELSALDSKSTGTLSDAISNQSAITLFTGVTDEEKRYRTVTNEQGAKQRFMWISNNSMDSFQLLFLVTIEFAVVYVALIHWESWAITIGTFVLVQTFIGQIGSKISDLGRVVRTMYEVHAQATEMVEILKLPHDIRDVPDAQPLKIGGGTVRFTNVDFAFNQTRSILTKLNLTIQEGEKVALVGPSGAGKSTVTKLLMRLYDVSGGTIEIDGQNIAKITQESLREHIAFVPQEPILFHRTLKENIAYGKRGATDEEVIEAAKKAHCHEFIASLPDGYDTHVGERGVKLSGGERQRVAIARAILKNAPILILDEATSSLDSESEALIQDALATLMEGKTVVVISHRLSTIMRMDRIIVIDGGKVIDDGTHQELLAKDGLYQKLWNIQAGGFIQE